MWVAALQAKIEQKELQERTKREQAAQMAIKQAARMKEIAYEKKLEQDYIEMLDKQEAARNKRLDDLAGKMQNKQAAFLKNTEEQRRKEREDDRRRLAQQEAKRVQLEREAHERELARKARNRAQVKQLNAQMQFKRDQEARRQRELREFAIAQNKEMAKQLKAEEKKSSGVRTRNVAHRRVLEKMMAADRAKRNRYKEADMDPLQLAINAKTLNKAYARPVGRSDERLARDYQEMVRKTQGSTIIRGPC